MDLLGEFDLHLGSDQGVFPYILEIQIEGTVYISTDSPFLSGHPSPSSAAYKRGTESWKIHLCVKFNPRLHIIIGIFLLKSSRPDGFSLSCYDDGSVADYLAVLLDQIEI